MQINFAPKMEISESNDLLSNKQGFLHFVKTSDKKQGKVKKKIGSFIRKFSEKKLPSSSYNIPDLIEIFPDKKLPSFRAKGKYFVREVENGS